jgi:ABC-type transport system involved in multi-copper enzyme maturation permease subunit
MTTVPTTIPASRRPATAEPAGIPFGRLVRTELRKLTDTRASRWLIAGIVAATPVVLVVMLFAAGPKDLTYENMVDFTQTPQKLLLPALGLLAMTSEWSQRTGLVTFTLVPDRRRVLLAKFAATLVLALVVIALAFGSAAVGNVLGMALRQGNGSWSLGLSGAGEITLVLLSGLLQAMAFGMAVLVTSAAVGLYYVVPNLSSVLFGATPGLKSFAPWVDLNNAQGPLYSHDITGKGWLQLLIASTIWILVPLAFGIWRVSRTEVRSA